MSARLMTEQEIAAGLKRLEGWTLSGKQIEKIVQLADFTKAMGFVVSVALLAQAHDHHPDIDIRWNTVKMILSTHSAGGLTSKDFALAAEIDMLTK
jgi:4a-hydroxytetrahydrobiopterin dehydratase